MTPLQMTKRIAKNLGIQVEVGSEGPTHIHITDGAMAIWVNVEEFPTNRSQTFAILHELGHAVLHLRGDKNQMKVIECYEFKAETGLEYLDGEAKFVIQNERDAWEAAIELAIVCKIRIDTDELIEFAEDCVQTYLNYYKKMGAI